MTPTTPRKTTKRRSTSSGRFRVANPRGHPKGRAYIKVGGQRFHEGDIFDVSSDRVDIDRLLETGKLVKDGR